MVAKPFQSLVGYGGEFAGTGIAHGFASQCRPFGRIAGMLPGFGRKGDALAKLRQETATGFPQNHQFGAAHPSRIGAGKTYTAP